MYKVLILALLLVSTAAASHDLPGAELRPLPQYEGALDKSTLQLSDPISIEGQLSRITPLDKTASSSEALLSPDHICNILSLVGDGTDMPIQFSSYYSGYIIADRFSVQEYRIIRP